MSTEKFPLRGITMRAYIAPSEAKKMMDRFLQITLTLGIAKWRDSHGERRADARDTLRWTIRYFREYAA